VSQVAQNRGLLKLMLKLARSQEILDDSPTCGPNFRSCNWDRSGGVTKVIWGLGTELSIPGVYSIRIVNESPLN
jgi:hypothetical protein